MRVLIVSWASFLHGEAAAGDVASMYRVASALETAGIPHDSAWSPMLRPAAMSLADAPAQNYTDVVFVCGRLHGWQVEQLHDRYASCHRVAVGSSVTDPHSPAYTRFHAVLARDFPGAPAIRDLSAGVAYARTPVAALVLAPGRWEHGAHLRQERVHQHLLDWFAGVDCATIVADSRLDTGDSRRCATPDQFAALLDRSDVVVTTRLHGLAFGLACGVPVLAVDTTAGGGKLSAQATAWEWPALLSAEDVHVGPEHAHPRLQRWWEWCRTAEARVLAEARAAEAPAAGRKTMSRLLDDLHSRASQPEGT